MMIKKDDGDGDGCVWIIFIVCLCIVACVSEVVSLFK